MSAYGHIQRNHASAPLPSTTWRRSVNNEENSVSVYHLTIEAARTLPGLLEYLGTVFAKEVADGLTYPQEGEMNQMTFETYFFSADVFIGLIGTSKSSGGVLDAPSTNHVDDAISKNRSLIERQRDGNGWGDCIAGYYYVRTIGIEYIGHRV